MGAPVMSFCRIDDKPIRTHEPVTEPDALIVQDPTLLHQADLLAGLTSSGYMLVNSTRSFAELGLAEFVREFRPERLLVVPASALATTHLGRPLPGAMLGGFAALTSALRAKAPLMWAMIAKEFRELPRAGGRRDRDRRPRSGSSHRFQ
jgi:pyruvate ferredoxin oxidoreductase gamma subunit